MRPLGVILAGGRGRRMGGADKALLELAGRPLLAHVIERLGPQVDGLVLSANGDARRFAAFDLPVAADALPGNLGPLGGVAAGLQAAVAAGRDRIVTAAVDTPFLPHDYVARLERAARAGLAVAASNGREHPVCGLWPVNLLDDMTRRLSGGERRIGDFARRHGAGRALFDAGPPDPFFNINTPGDRDAAEAVLRAHR